MRTLEQKRAEFAYEKVRSVKGSGFEEEYVSYVKSAPAQILTNGLGATLAFFKSKKKDAYSALYDHIEEWFKRCGFCSGDALEWITRVDSMEVFQATRETFALLKWMAKFAKSILEGS
jgi:CRISPR-associated protein Cmr5